MILWHALLVQSRLYHRCFVFLGILAVFAALVSMPLATTYAFVMAGQAAHVDTMKMAGADEMPCHKAAKPCPDCPQKVCPELGTCLVKCFQPVPSPAAEARLITERVSDRVAPTLARVAASSLIPPLLRPPSV